MKPSIFVFSILCICLSCFTSISQGANLWQQDTITSAPEAGIKCSVFIDKSGAVHMAWLEDSGSSRIIRYANRRTPGETSPAVEQVGPIFSDSIEPEHLDIAVRRDGTVDIANTRANGTIHVYRKGPSDSNWVFVSVGSDANTGNNGGVSISENLIVYTTASGNLKRSTRSGETWSTPFNFTSGASTGLAPDLASSNDSDTPFVVVFFDDNTKEIKSRTLRAAFSGGPRTWTSATVVDGTTSFTRPSVDIYRNTVGVAYRKSPETGSSINYASRALDVPTATWLKLITTDADEINPDNFEAFGNDPVVTHDAIGNPWVVYKRINLLRTVDVVGRRRLPDLFWEKSLVQAQASGLGVATGQIAIASNGAGDPAIVYEADQGTNSNFTLTRPRNAPWTFERIKNSGSSSHQFATALTSNTETGDVYFVSDYSNTGFQLVDGILQFVTTQNPAQLVSIRKSSRTTINIPNSTAPRIAHAIATTPNGIVHVIGQEADGELFHDRFIDGLVHAGRTNVTWGGNTASISATGGLAAGSDREGNLFLAFRRPSTGIRVARLPAGSDTWENVTETNSGGMALDLVVRGDGKIAVSHYNPAGRRILVHTNMDIRTGNPLNFFESIDARALASAEPDPASTSLILIGNKLRLAAALRGPLIYMKPATIGPLPFTSSEVSTGFRSSKIRLISPRNGEVSAIIQTPLTDSTRLTHLAFSDNSPSSSPTSDRLADDLPSGAGDIHATRDAHGFPIFSTNFSTGLLISFSSQHSQLVRPADALDLDFDGVPLILEDAFCMNPEIKDAHLVRTPSARQFGDPGNRTVSLDFPHRYPDGEQFAFSNDLQSGEFHYRVSYSTDLIDFDDFIPLLSGITPAVTTATDPEVGVKFQTLSLRFRQSYLDGEPKTFSKLEVFRLKDDIFSRL